MTVPERLKRAKPYDTGGPGGDCRSVRCHLEKSCGRNKESLPVRAHTVAPGGVVMLLSLLQFFATKFLVLALHLEAGSFPKPLNAREEIETFAALRAGDRSAREKLIRHNLRLVAHVAKKYYAQPTEQEDLISIGTIGLMKAVDTFDTTRKARFSTYASRCIENAILTPANAGRRIGTISTALGGVLVPIRVYRESGPVDFILR